MILIQFHNKRNHTSVLIDVGYHIKTKPVELVLNINFPSAVVMARYNSDSYEIIIHNDQ